MLDGGKVAGDTVDGGAVDALIADPSDLEDPSSVDPVGLVSLDGVTRCSWCINDSQYRQYHDQEWGRPVRDDTRIYEKLCLEGFQAGLSWLVILRKREAFRQAFAGFDPSLVARFGSEEVARLLGDAGIVRHRGKIEAAIANARATLSIQRTRGSLAELVWSFAEPSAPAPSVPSDIAAQTPASRALSAALRQAGFRFLGPRTAYAAMQSLGLVNDHLAGCDFRQGCGPRSRAEKLSSLA